MEFKENWRIYLEMKEYECTCLYPEFKSSFIRANFHTISLLRSYSNVGDHLLQRFLLRPGGCRLWSAAGFNGGSDFIPPFYK